MSEVTSLEQTIVQLYTSGTKLFDIAAIIHKRSTFVRNILQSHGIRITRSALKNPIITTTHQSVILGSLLGDGSLESQFRNTNVTLAISHSTKQRDYIEWKHRLLKDLCTGAIGSVHHGVALRFRTAALPQLEPERLRWYPEGQKILPSGAEDELDFLSLAIWFMDDGSGGFDNGRLNSARISTCNFEQYEVQRLVDVLREKFSLDCKMILERGKGPKSPYPLIRFSAQGSRDLRDSILPIMPESMHYKLVKRATT